MRLGSRHGNGRGFRDRDDVGRRARRLGASLALLGRGPALVAGSRLGRGHGGRRLRRRLGDGRSHRRHALLQRGKPRLRRLLLELALADGILDAADILLISVTVRRTLPTSASALLAAWMPGSVSAIWGRCVKREQLGMPRQGGEVCEPARRQQPPREEVSPDGASGWSVVTCRAAMTRSVLISLELPSNYPEGRWTGARSELYRTVSKAGGPVNA